MAQDVAPQHRDIIVIGASLGGREALTKVLNQLPRDFPASIFYVQHLAPNYPSFLTDLLAKESARSRLRRGP